MSKRFVIVLVIIFLGFLGIFFTTGHKKAAAPSANSSAQTTKHLLGSGKKGVTLIEYGDYQCPACGAYYPLVKSLADKYKDDIYLQFSNFPLQTIHQNAFAGARAAEAADKQGKFWEMHNLLYEQQTTWSAGNNPQVYFDQYAQQLGLNITQFDQDFASSAVNDLINADIKAGQAIGADSTPTFVLDGKKIDNNPQSQDAFNKLIEKEIAAKNK
jgi:protein-disulfide isomerase